MAVKDEPLSTLNTAEKSPTPPHHGDKKHYRGLNRFFCHCCERLDGARTAGRYQHLAHLMKTLGITTSRCGDLEPVDI